MMEEKIIPIIKNFNSNYNKFKKYIENEFPISGLELIKLFQLIEFFSSVKKIGDCIDIYDDSMIKTLLPQINETKEMIEYIENRSIKFFENFPIDNFKKYNIDTGIKTGMKWRNIEKLQDSSKEKINIIFDYFQEFLKLYKLYHIILTKK